jgi:adenosylhomocysteinase
LFGDQVSAAVPVHQVSRRQCADPENLARHLDATAAGRDVVLLDIGGYFAPSLAKVEPRYPGRILGVVEDTENGFQRYQTRGLPPCPVFSVARSPLKEAEDYLVGQSVVFSIEALLRSRGDILQGRPALVVGFGKIGRSVAGFLRGRGVRVSIYDTSAIKRAEALAHGYGVHTTVTSALADALLIVGATGNRSIPGDALASIRPGAYLATVTSSDDELDLPGLATYQRDEIAPDVIRYRQGKGRYFFLLNDGQAVNFTHGAVVGPFIHLVQAEILVALCELQQHAPAAGFHEIDTRHREHLAQLWLRAFGAPSVTPDHLRGAAT